MSECQRTQPHAAWDESSGMLPLWLDAGEAETLAGLCLASLADGGPREHSLFLKIGTLLRAFRRDGGGGSPTV